MASGFRPAGSRPVVVEQPQPAAPKPARQQGGTLGSFATDMIRALGGKPTPQAQKLFSSWQRWEGGWSNNAAAYNPLNLTAPGSGLRTINSVGVVAMPSYQEGVKRTAELLQRRYPALAQAFRTGQIDFRNPQVQANLNMWLSGKATPGVTPYVAKIAKAYGANMPAGAAASPEGAPTPLPRSLPQAPQYQTKFDPNLFRSQIRNAFLQGGGRIDLMSMPGMQQGSYVQTPLPNPAPGPEDSPPSLFAKSGHEHGETPGVATRSGKGILAPAAFKKTHDTSGLGWPAVDIMGSPGTPLRTPVAGVVVRHGSAQGGEAMYIDTNGDGEGDYWAGHITNMVPIGTKLRVGDRFADISPDHAAPHLHWARR